MDQQPKNEMPVRLPLDGDLVYQQMSERMSVEIDETTGFQVIVFKSI